MSNGDDLTYENEIKKIKVGLTDLEDAKKEADILMIKKVEKYEAQIKDLKNLPSTLQLILYGIDHYRKKWECLILMLLVFV